MWGNSTVCQACQRHVSLGFTKGKQPRLSSPQRCPSTKGQWKILCPQARSCFKALSRCPQGSAAVRPDLCGTGFPWGSTCVTARGHGAAETAHVHPAAGTGSMGAALPGTSTAGSSLPAGDQSRPWLQRLLAQDGQSWREPHQPCFPFCCRGRGLTQGIQLCSSQPHLATWLYCKTLHQIIASM